MFKNVTLPQEFHKLSGPTRNDSLSEWPDNMLERVAPTQRISDVLSSLVHLPIKD